MAFPCKFLQDNPIYASSVCAQVEPANGLAMLPAFLAGSIYAAPSEAHVRVKEEQVRQWVLILYGFAVEIIRLLGMFFSLYSSLPSHASLSLGAYRME